MSWLPDLRLIRFFSFYLALFFCVSTYLRTRQYRALLGLVRNMPGRWPRLLGLIRKHGSLFLTWGTVMPLLLSLLLFLLNTCASRLLWPRADDFTAAQLLAMWPALPLVVLSGVAMLGLDLYGLWQVGEIDRAEMEKYFDQAEYWLRSRASHVVRIVTLGYVNPRKMVAVEVRSALVSASRLINYNLWWMVLQTGLRIAFGLSLWGAYALEPWLLR